MHNKNCLFIKRILIQCNSPDLFLPSSSAHSLLLIVLVILLHRLFSLSLPILDSHLMTMIVGYIFVLNHNVQRVIINKLPKSFRMRTCHEYENKLTIDLEKRVPGKGIFEKHEKDALLVPSPPPLINLRKHKIHL